MKKTLTLLGIFIVLALFVYFYEYKGGKEREKADEFAATLLKIEERDVKSVTLTGGEEKETITYTRGAPGEWLIVSPVNTEAEKSAVNGNISAFANAKISRRLSVKVENLQDFGLDPPSAEVTVKTMDDKWIKLGIGDEAITRGDLFVLLEQPTDSMGFEAGALAARDTVEVLVTGVNVLNQARKTLFDLRDKKIAHYDDNEVRRIELSSPEGEITLEKSADEWEMLSPAQFPVDESRVRSFLSSTLNYSAKEFVSETLDDPERYGFDQPTVNLRLNLGDEMSTKEITIGGTGEENNEFYGYESGRSSVFLIRESTKKSMSKDPFYFLNKKIVRFSEDELSEIRFSGSYQVTLTREDTAQWYAYGDSVVEIPKTDMNRLFSRLRSLNVTEIVSDSPGQLKKYGLSQEPSDHIPYLEAIITDTAGQVTGFTVGDTLGNDRYIKSVDFPFVYLVSGSQVKRLTDWLKQQVPAASLPEKKKNQPPS